MKTLTSFAVASGRILTRTESATPLTSSPRCIATDSLGLPSKLRLSQEPEANFSYVRRATGLNARRAAPRSWRRGAS